MSATNPSLFETPSPLRHNAFDFSKLKISDFLPALDRLIASAHKSLQAIRSRPVEQSTLENTLVALETVSEEIELFSLIFFNLLSADSSPELQALAPEVSTRLSAFGNDLILDPEIFRRVQYVHEHQRADWQEVDQTLVENNYIEFVRNGALLSDEQKSRLREIDGALAKLAPQFQDNVLQATNSFEMLVATPEELKGLSADDLQRARQAAQEKGHAQGYLFTLHEPSYMAIIRSCENRELRRRMYMAQNTRAFGGEYDNRPILRQIVELRHQRAQLLGYSTHAHFVLERRMAESPEKVQSFLQDLLRYIQPAAQRELTEMREFARTNEKLNDLEPWDVPFLSERMKKARFNLDPDLLKPYFPLETVLTGLFEHAHRLYGLRFVESKQYPVYHNEVRVFEVVKTDGHFVGLFYMDLFPRTSKRSGAWMTNYLQQGLFRGQMNRPHVSIVCNFPKPVEGHPALLKLTDVRTLFHEFGHALHGLLSQVKYRSLAGTSVYWDFVELPSQIMENWAIEKEGLALIARHYETNETLPVEWVQKIKDSENFHAGIFGLRQLSLGMLDMAYHSTPPEQWSDLEEFERRVLKDTTLLPAPKGTGFSSAFSHIFAGGYSAGYYSYKWAEVLEADAFEYFLEKGIFNPEVSRKFHDCILSAGGSTHPAVLYQRFRGRDPDPKALLRREGLLQ